MSESIWKAAKEAMEKYLEQIREENGYSQKEMTCNIITAEKKMVIFEIHKTLKDLILAEIRKKSLKEDYSINFNATDDEKWEMKLEAKGYESFIFAGMLASIHADLKSAREKRINQSLAAITSIIKEVLSQSGFKKGCKWQIKHDDTAHLFIAQIMIKDKGQAVEPIRFAHENVIGLIQEITNDLPVKLQEKTKQ